MDEQGPDVRYYELGVPIFSTQCDTCGRFIPSNGPQAENYWGHVDACGKPPKVTVRQRMRFWLLRLLSQMGR